MLPDRDSSLAVRQERLQGNEGDAAGTASLAPMHELDRQVADRNQALFPAGTQSVTTVASHEPYMEALAENQQLINELRADLDAFRRLADERESTLNELTARLRDVQQRLCASEDELTRRERQMDALHGELDSVRHLYTEAKRVVAPWQRPAAVPMRSELPSAVQVSERVWDDSGWRSVQGVPSNWDMVHRVGTLPLIANAYPDTANMDTWPPVGPASPPIVIGEVPTAYEAFTGQWPVAYHGY